MMWHGFAGVFTPEELFGTKLRALLQRRKNRDMFDLHYALERLASYCARGSRQLRYPLPIG